MKKRIVVLVLIVGPLLAVGSLAIYMAIGFYRASHVPSLHSAAGAGNLQEVKSLIAAGTPVNMQITGAWDAYQGQTALMWAAWHGHADVARFLLDNGADPSMRDASGHTAKDFAEMDGNDLVLQILEQYK